MPSKIRARTCGWHLRMTVKVALYLFIRSARVCSPPAGDPGQQLSRQSKVSTDQRGMTHESADCCGPAVPRLERARSRGYVRLRLQRRGRRYRDVHAASGRFAAAGTALQCDKARDADGGERGQALPHRCRALQAVPGVQLQHRQELRARSTSSVLERSRRATRTSRLIVAAAFSSARPMALTKWA